MLLRGIANNSLFFLFIRCFSHHLYCKKSKITQMSSDTLYKMLDETCSSPKKLYQLLILHLYNFQSRKSMFHSDYSTIKRFQKNVIILYVYTYIYISMYICVCVYNIIYSVYNIIYIYSYKFIFKYICLYKKMLSSDPACAFTTAYHRAISFDDLDDLQLCMLCIWKKFFTKAFFYLTSLFCCLMVQMQHRKPKMVDVAIQAIYVN